MRKPAWFLVMFTLIITLLFIACDIIGIKDTVAPGDVSGLTILEGNNSVTLSWTDPADPDLHYIQIGHNQDLDVKYQVTKGIQSVVLGNLEGGTAYAFTVKAVDNAGNLSEGQIIVGTPLIDTTPPGEVENLAATPGDGSVVLSWNDPSDADLNRIEVTYSPSGLTPLTVSPGGETIQISGLTNATLYTFTVKTADHKGNLSAGQTITATPVTDTTPPAEVENLAATPGDGSVVLSWDDPLDIDLNRIEVTYSPGGLTPLTVSPGGETIQISGLTNATLYTFTVKTADHKGNLSAGQTITATPVTDTTPPGEVENLAATPGDGSVVLSWDDPLDIDLNRIEVTYSPGGLTPLTVSPGGETIQISGLTNATLYTFTVKTADHKGNLSAGQTITATPVTDTTPPGEVENLSASPGDGSVVLSWNDPSDADLNRIEVTYSPGGVTPLTVSPGGETIQISGLTNATLYTFTVKTADHKGNLSAGQTITATPVTDTTPPGEVENLAATPGDGSVVLSWGDPLDADLNHIEITHDQAGGTTPIFVNRGVGTATIFGLTNYLEYTFTVVTVDNAGNSSTGISQNGTPYGDTTPTGPVSSLLLTPLDGMVLLQWSDPVEADLNHIEITHDQTGGSTAINVAAGVGTAHISGLTNGVLYTFTLVAVDNAGNLSTGTNGSTTPLALDTSPPSDVTGVTVAVGSGEVTLSWTDPGNDDFELVEITHNLTGGSTPVTVLKGVETANIIGLTNGLTYTFTLKAVDYSQNRSAGVTISASPDAVGDLGLSINFDDPNNPTVTINGTSAELNRTLNQTMILSADAGGESITSLEWYVDSTYVTSSASWTLYATSYPVGVHTITVFVVIGGKYYSGEARFTVIN